MFAAVANPGFPAVCWEFLSVALVAAGQQMKPWRSPASGTLRLK